MPMDPITQMTEPIPIRTPCPDCPIGGIVTLHGAKIGFIEQTLTEVAKKLDRLLWGIIVGFGGIVAALLLRK